MQTFKSLSARRVQNHDLMHYRCFLHSSGRFQLWKRRFDDIIIVSEQQFERKLQYIHNNPVRAGLVAQATEWRFSSARTWLIDEPGEIEITKDFRWITY